MKRIITILSVLFLYILLNAFLLHSVAYANINPPDIHPPEIKPPSFTPPSPPEAPSIHPPTINPKETKVDENKGGGLSDRVIGGLEKLKNGLGELWDGISQVVRNIWGKVGEYGIKLWKSIKEHPILSILIAIGVIAAFMTGVGEVGLAAGGIGAGAGELGIGGLLGTLFAGDVFTGGISGAASAGIFRLVAGMLARSRFGVWAVDTFGSWFGRAIPNLLSGSVSAFTDSALYDWLKNRKIDWGKASKSALLGFTVLFGVHSTPQLVSAFNKIPLPSPVYQVFADGSVSSTPKTIGDTAFGQWLQKFEGKRDANLAEPEIEGLVKRVPARGKVYETKDGAIIKGGRIVKVNSVPKYRPATGNIDLEYVAKVRKQLGIPALGDDLKLKQSGVLKNEQTVAVLESDGVQIWGRNGWGADVGGYTQLRNEWMKGTLGRNGEIRGKDAVNNQTRYHAEGDVFFHLYLYRKQHKIIGGKARLVVDRPFCDACGPDGGVRSLVEEVGLDELEVITPNGKEIIKPRPEEKRTSW